MKFVVEVYDVATHCVESDVIIELPSIQELIRLLGWAEFMEYASYRLNRLEVGRLNRRVGRYIDANAVHVEIRLARNFDDLPYKVHTNRELLLMLKGEKPLSVFVEENRPEAMASIIPENSFAPYVAAGLFVKEEIMDISRDGEGRVMRQVFYALPNEVWRIRAYELLWKTSRKTGWSEAFERMEGTLL